MWARERLLLMMVDSYMRLEVLRMRLPLMVVSVHMKVRVTLELFAWKPVLTFRVPSPLIMIHRLPLTVVVRPSAEPSRSMVSS